MTKKGLSLTSTIVLVGMYYHFRQLSNIKGKILNSNSTQDLSTLLMTVHTLIQQYLYGRGLFAIIVCFLVYFLVILCLMMAATCSVIV